VKLRLREGNDSVQRENAEGCVSQSVSQSVVCAGVTVRSNIPSSPFPVLFLIGKR
jgi:hypothetical protein